MATTTTTTTMDDNSRNKMILYFKYILIAIFTFSFLEKPSQAQQNDNVPQPNNEGYSQMSVYALTAPQDLSRWLLLSLHGTPSNISQQDLDIFAEALKHVYQQEQDQDHTTEGNSHRLNITSVMILPNQIFGYGSEPRIIPSGVDFSFLVQFDFVCKGCQTTGYDLFDYQDSFTVTRQNAYEVPFPSSQLYIKPRVPNPQDLIAAYNEAIMGMEDIPGIDMGYGVAALRIGTDECEETNANESEFASLLTIAFYGDTNIPDLEDQLNTVEQIFIATYNELNVLNPITCDPHSRILTNATAVLFNNNTAGGATRRRLRRNGYDWKFLNIYFGGTCYGCPSNACLANDISGHATCGSRRRRRHLQEEVSSFDSCYCTEGGVSGGLPTNEDLLTALEENFEILRNETGFVLIESIVYLIEVEVPDSCCGWPVNGNIPVDVNDVGFQTAVTSYVSTGASSYGFPINCWDVSGVTDMTSAFQDQGEFNQQLSCWDTSNVMSMSRMFDGASKFNNDISDWDTSQVADMSFMFSEASSFNGDVSSWDTSEVTTMRAMFFLASNFNGDVSNWVTSKVSNMYDMFYAVSNFNSNLALWDTSRVTNMRAMFTQATSFNSDLSLWNTSQVKNMFWMFYLASSFNSDLSQWDTNKVTDMGHMFYQATSFNNDLSTWDTSKVTNMDEMFNFASQFQQNLCSWRLTDGNLVSALEVFVGSNCLNMSDPSPGIGPWCFNC